jgi:uncharacterized protein YmfQ (DUF2313 family)
MSGEFASHVKWLPDGRVVYDPPHREHPACCCEVCQRRNARFAKLAAENAAQKLAEEQMPPTDTEMLDYLEEHQGLDRDRVRAAMASIGWSRT